MNNRTHFIWYRKYIYLLSMTNVRIKPETHMNLSRIRLSRYSIASLNVLQDKVIIKVITIYEQRMTSLRMTSLQPICQLNLFL